MVDCFLDSGSDMMSLIKFASSVCWSTVVSSIDDITSMVIGRFQFPNESGWLSIAGEADPAIIMTAGRGLSSLLSDSTMVCGKARATL